MKLVKVGMILPTYATDQFNCIYPLEVLFAKTGGVAPVLLSWELSN